MNDPSLLRLRVLGVSGSLRARSLDTALLHAAIELAPTRAAASAALVRLADRARLPAPPRAPREAV
ncbi:uncharacterized protein SOCE26_099380 [Sorangium cellulosum]|uniref:Uncharacterized protein n=1 Tax=Sorangium cellulosum TaxID=56 RepID=A0A2L0FA08_SORCE|nr:hypothetical protein [Sorangium cellulosum]AUX48404.1 uncharacterized protein SOCE26_099380 [Sorangium cellulosum]